MFSVQRSGEYNTAPPLARSEYPPVGIALTRESAVSVTVCVLDEAFACVFTRFHWIFSNVEYIRRVETTLNPAPLACSANRTVHCTFSES
jgi:hypothetical protein